MKKQKEIEQKEFIEKISKPPIIKRKYFGELYNSYIIKTKKKK